MMKKISIAKHVLGHYVPQASEAARRAVLDAQLVAQEALQARDIFVARWLVETMLNCLSYAGLVAQLRPLLKYLPLDMIVNDSRLAVKALLLARELEDEALLAAACAGVSKGMDAKHPTADELGHHGNDGHGVVNPASWQRPHASHTRDSSVAIR